MTKALKQRIPEKIKRRRILAVSALILAAIAAIIAFFPSRDDLPFQRLQSVQTETDSKHFSWQPEGSILYFIRGDQRRRFWDVLSNRLNFFALSGESRTITWSPETRGLRRFYTYVSVEPFDRNGLTAVQLGLQRGKSTIPLEKQDIRGRGNLFVIKDMKLRVGDKIVLVAKGKGIVTFTHPILYRKVSTSQRKLVILIGLDTLRQDCIGLQVNGASITPNLDRFMKDSVVFSHTYAQSSWTLASFMNMFTGRNETRIAMNRHTRLPKDIPSLTEFISNRYVTVSLNGGGYVHSNFGFSRGFDHYRPLSQLSHRGAADSGQTLFQLALGFMRRTEFPNLFLFLHTYQVHQPYEPPAKFLQRIRPGSRFTSLKTPRGPETFRPESDPERASAYKDLYYAEILAFDHYFGEFVAELKQRGLYDQTMLVFMSDHGEEFFEHHGWEHGHGLYEEQIRVPLIVKFPANRHAGRTIESPAAVVDIMPTILAACDISLPESLANKLDGRDLMSKASENESPRTLLSSVSLCRMLEKIPPRFSLIRGRYKVIVNYDFPQESLDYFSFLPPVTGGIELYDLEADPGESLNLAKKRPDLVRSFMPRIVELRRHLSSAFAGLAQPESSDLDPELKKRLETLGYL